MRYLIFAFLMIGCLTACEDNPPAKTSDEQLQEYFAENGITPQATGSGLYYVIDEPGGAEKPSATSTVTINYRGTLLNGDEFDSSYRRNQPLISPLSNLISGWIEGIQLFGKGGKGTLYIPAELAYGSAARGSIPPHSPLIFEIEVIDFD